MGQYVVARQCTPPEIIDGKMNLWYDTKHKQLKIYFTDVRKWRPIDGWVTPKMLWRERLWSSVMAILKTIWDKARS